MTQNQKLGLAVIQLFGLKEIKNQYIEDERYKTTWGTKTAEGIGACIIRLVEESKK